MLAKQNQEPIRMRRRRRAFEGLGASGCLEISVAIAAAIAAGCSSPQHQTAATLQPTAEGLRPAPNPLRNAYFGDLHLHTSYSFDAVASGTTTVPDDSYHYAQGGEVDYLGQPVRRRAKLDFLAVTDHAEYLGVVREAADPKGPFANTDWPGLFKQTDPRALVALFRRLSTSGFQGGGTIPEFLSEGRTRENWDREVDAAQRNYRPGYFTTFVAFEWSAMPGGAHLHRNVIFRGPRFPDRPFSALDSMHPEDLWRYAENLRGQGIDSVLIPHNSNLSDGLMFAFRDSEGNPLTRAYAEHRAANERLVEITQNKGTSETRPELSPNDEFAGFELMNLRHEGLEGHVDGSYVRQALGRGLEVRARVGVNPFRYGFVGATDFHSGISSTEEFNYPGALGRSDAQDHPDELLTQASPITGSPLTVLSAGGLTGVWAEENTRESIFDALRRREVFATTGGRMQVRMFVGAYPRGTTDRADWLRRAYAVGTPMGGDLPPGFRGAPRILLNAVKDPDSANLDRIQVVKVWLANGHAQESVYDAVWSGDRRPASRTGRLPPVGNTVDLKTATYTDAIGATELKGEWTDPEFDPKVPAIYYARVLEAPTPRWTTYLAVKNHLPLPNSAPPTIQERAWTSPVFYQP
jgi:hypothetical protein